MIQVQYINRNIKFIENMSQAGDHSRQNNVEGAEIRQKKSQQANKSIVPSKQRSQKSSQKPNQNVNDNPHKSKEDSIKSKSKKQMSERQWSAVYENNNFGLDQRNLLKQAAFKKKDQKIQGSHKNTLQQIQWEAAYIDQKFYLSDPSSLAKLRQLENQIEIEKEKLINIEVAERFDKSFLSQRPVNAEGQNEKLQILTQINDSQLFHRKQNAEKDLLNQEQKYRNRIEQMKKKKSILKKQIGCGTNDKNLQVNASQILRNQQEQPKQKTQKEKLSRVEKSQKISQRNEEEAMKKSASAVVENSANKLEKSLKVIQKPESEKKSVNEASKVSQKAESQKKSNVVEKKSVEKKEIQKSESHKSSKNKDEVSNKQIDLPELPPNIKYSLVESSESPKKSQKLSRKDEVKQNSVKDTKLEGSLQPPLSYKQSKIPSEKHSEINSTPKSKKTTFQKKQQLEVEQKSASKQQTKKAPSIRSQKINQPQHVLKSQNKSQVRQKSQKQTELMIENKSQKKPEKSQRDEQIQKASKRQEKEQKQKSKKSAAIQQPSSPSQRQKKQIESTHKNNVDKEKQLSRASHKQKSVDLSPKIQINVDSFKKTDKSVQWEQIEVYSKSKYQTQKGERVDQSRNNPVEEKTERQPSHKSKSMASQKISNYDQKSKVASHQNKEANQLHVPEQTVSKKKQDMSVKSSKKETTERNIPNQVSRNQKSIKKSEVEHNITQNDKLSTSKQPKDLGNSRNLFSEKQPSQIHGSSSQIFETQRRQKSQKVIQNEPGSEKKRTSFKIHSRQSSVKSKKSSSKPSSYSNYNQRLQALDNSKIQSQSNKRKGQDQSMTEKQIKNLHQQINELQEKLKRVEQKQEQMIKFENNQSNIMSEVQASHAASGSEPVSPLGKFNLTSRLKLQAKLTLQGSTVQFNTYEQQMKKTAQTNEKLEKLKLQQEIGRLKKIIRDMQIQKIKSIQYDPNQSLHKIEQRRLQIIDSQENIREKNDERWKESLMSDMLQTKRNDWNTETLYKQNQEAGKIKKNSPGKFPVDSPRKYNRINAERSKQFSQMDREEQKEHAPLPLRRKAQSVHNAVHTATHTGGVRKDLTKSDLINKFEENQRNFHQFIESSRLLPQQPQSYVQPANNSAAQNFDQKHLPQIMPSQIKKSPHEEKEEMNNFSQILEKLKYENPEDQIKSPSDINIGNILMPNLPEAPNLSMSQDDFLELAKKTYQLFGISIGQNQNQLCMKKYKNCVVFTFGNNQQNTVLWHYSGKFYFGGWKNTSDPGEGEKIGQGLEYIPGKHIYKGQFLGGKKNGNGILKNANGNIYDGQWVDGIKNGRGVYFEANTGTYYSGEWKDGKRDGYGVLKFSNNEFYEGTFVKSIKQGYGVEKFANGDFYKGQYQRGKFHGKGKYCWSNGSSYEGDFVDGCRHGQGSWRSSRKAGDIYVGGYQNDKKCGYGRYVWANGCVYEGYFKNDLKNGKGRLVYQDGKQIKGNWQDGNLTTTENQTRKVQDHEDSPLRRSIRASSLKNATNSHTNGYRNSVHL